MSSPEEESEQEGFPTLLHCYELASIIAHHIVSEDDPPIQRGIRRLDVPLLFKSKDFVTPVRQGILDPLLNRAMPDADAADRKEVRRDILWCLKYVLQFELIMADADDRWRGAGGVSRVQRSVAFSHVPPPSPEDPPDLPPPPLQWYPGMKADSPRHLGQKRIPEGSPTCLSGMRMVITGQLDSMYREDAQALIERHGGQVSGRVSSRGQYVVAGIDADTGERTNGSKIQKALRLGARIIDEDGLFELIAASRPQMAGQATASAAVVAPQMTENLIAKLPVEVFHLHILPWCGLRAASLFGLASKACSKILYGALHAEEGASKLDRWERWSRVDPDYNFDWDNVVDTVLEFDDEVAILQRRRALLASLRRAIAAATLSATPDEIIELITSWTAALRDRPVYDRGRSFIQDKMYDDGQWRWHVEDISVFIRRWRTQQPWTPKQLVRLARGALYGSSLLDKAAPCSVWEVVPAEPPLYVDPSKSEHIFSEQHDQSKWRSTEHFSLEEIVRDELAKENRRELNRWTHRVNLAALGLPEDDEGEISSVDIAQLIVKSFETPGSVQLPDGLLRLRAHAIDDWRKRWLAVLRESAFEMTHDFHRTLRATTVSDVPCAPKELNEDDVKVSASLRVAFSRVTLTLYTENEAEDDETIPSWISGRARRARRDANEHCYNVRKFDDLGSDGVALLREYLELMPAGVLPRLKAEFVVYLFCVRMGNPKGKLQSFAIDPDGAKCLGEAVAELPFGVRDIEALLVSDLVKLSRHEDDPKERIPWIVFTAWAARTGFPSWRGGDAVALGRALRRIFGSMYERWLEERAQIRIRVKP